MGRRHGESLRRARRRACVRPVVSAQEDRPGTPPIAIITYALWQRKFGAAPDVVGRTLVVDNRAMEIVGILPSEFSFLTCPSKTDIWIPLGADPSDGRRFTRGGRSMGVLGRLRPGGALAEVRAEADTIAAGLATAYPFFNTGRRFAVVPLGEQVARDVRAGALALFGAVACVRSSRARTVQPELARATSQHRDLPIREALGVPLAAAAATCGEPRCRPPAGPPARCWLSGCRRS
jgi:putative ABC transport system permease protein